MTTTQEEDEKGRPFLIIVGAGSKHGSFKECSSVDKQESSTPAASSPSKDENISNSVRWGLGGALSLLFAKSGYDIVLMGRKTDVLNDIKTMIEEEVVLHSKNGDNNDHDSKIIVWTVECDVTNDDSVKNAFDSTHQRASSFGGYIDLVIFNVAPPYPPNFRFEGWGDVLLPHMIDIDNMTMQHDTQINGLIRVSKMVLPGMIERQKGCLLVSGESCCNLHGRFEFGSVAPTRAALRSLSQCMFQAYGPMGIHVCNINIGGIIETPKTRTWTAEPKIRLTDPKEIAEQFLNVYLQKPTVWSYEINLTPSFSARKVDMRM